MRRALLLPLALLCLGARPITVASSRYQGQSKKPLVQLLPTVPDTLQAAGTLAGTRGQAVTVVRATARTCINSNGTLLSVAVDTPCVEAAGLSVAPTRENLKTRSQEWDLAPWVIQFSAGPLTPVVTANAGTAPDGTLTAEQLDFAATPNVNQVSMIRSGSVTTTDGSAYTFSLYAKGVSGSGTFYSSVFDSQWNTVGCAYNATTWTRCTLTRTVSAAGIDWLIGADRRDAQQLAQPANSVYLWGAQIELGSSPTRYVATGAATATVNAERVSIANPIPSGTPFCVGATYTPRERTWITAGAGNTLFALGTSGGASTNTLQASVSSTGELVVTVNDAAADTKTWTTAAVLTGTTAGHVTVCSSAAGAVTLYLDAVLVSATTSGTGTGILTTQPGTLYLGSRGAGTNHLGGHISNLCVEKRLGKCLR